MTISKQQNGSELTMALKGRLDTTTAPDFEKELKESLHGVNSLILDCRELDYVSSAGLRVLLFAHKTMSARDGMKIIHANEIIREVFDVTGFADFLKVE